MKKRIAYALIFALCISGLTRYPMMQAKVKAKKITLNCKKKTLYVGAKFKLKVKKVKPKKASKKVTWKSSNKKILTVSKSGVVKAKKAGRATVVVCSKVNKRVKAKCIFTVVKKGNSIPKQTPAPNKYITPRPKATLTPLPTPTVTPSSEPSTQPTTEPTKNPEQDEMCTVQFVDCDGTLLFQTKVKKGDSATPPEPPKRVGYLFSGWDKDYGNVMEDMTIKALYEKDNAVALIVDDAVVKNGEKDVFLPVYVNQNPGILGMTFSVLFDDNSLELVDALNGDAVSNVLTFTKANILKNNCRFTWDGQEMDDKDVKDGQVLILKFKLKDNIEPGEYNINIYYNEGDIVNRDLQPINFELRSGKITVS